MRSRLSPCTSPIHLQLRSTFSAYLETVRCPEGDTTFTHVQLVTVGVRAASICWPRLVSWSDGDTSTASGLSVGSLL